MTTSIRTTTVMAEIPRLGLITACIVTLAAMPAAAAVRCPTESDLDNGIRFSGGIDRAELVARRLTEQEMRLVELPASLRADYRAMTFGIRDKVNGQAVSVSYRGLFDSIFMSHLGGGNFSFATPIESLFPIQFRDDPKEVGFIWRIPTEAAMKPGDYAEAARGTLTLDPVANIDLIIDGCTFETILIKLTRAVVLTPTNTSQEPSPEPPTVYWRYYAPSLGIWLAEVSYTEQNEIWIEGMYDQIEYLKPGEAELFE
jgi:hypothetical protein